MIRRALNIDNLHPPMTEKLTWQIDAAISILEQKKDRHKSIKSIIRTLKRIRHRLNRPWRIAIIGEQNSGKTTLANVLLGDITLPTHVISNTHIPTLIHYATSVQINAVFHDGTTAPVRVQQIDDLSDIKRIDVGLPFHLLKNFELLDCPGIPEPEVFQREFNISHYHADAAFWCTSSTAPWRKSEKDCWDSLPERIKERSLLLVTRKDQLEPENLNKVLGRLKYETRNTTLSDIVFISSTQALVASENKENDENIWLQSGASELDQKLAALISKLQIERENSTKRTIESVTNHFIETL